MLPDSLRAEAEALVAACQAKRVKLATVESCTGGLIAAVLTAVAGASDVVDRGFVTYSNEAKTDLVGVTTELITQHGAVSEPVAAAMATGGLIRSRATMAIAVTGLAGPGGGTVDKPVGLVCFGLARRGEDTITARHVFPGGRCAIRAATVAAALAMIRDALDR